MNSQIARIRTELSISAAWRLLGLPGNPGKDCKSPFRPEEKRPSFSIYRKEGWERWFDHTTSQGGDVVDFWAIAKKISIKEAVQDILCRRPGLNILLEAPKRPVDAFLPSEGIMWPENLSEPSEAECRALGKLRSLSPEAFHLAGCLGTLLMGDQRNQRLWITTDCRMRSAARRRLDGQPLDGIGKKSAAPKNSPRDWIVGTRTRNPELDKLKNIVVVEGEGDYYAALQLAIESNINFKVLAILGAATKTFHADCHTQFRDAIVLVFPHNDRSLAGEKAAREWSALFYSWGAADVMTQGLPIICNDLNDFLIQRPDSGPQLLKGFHDGTTRRPKK
jgi:hypothetical protein